MTGYTFWPSISKDDMAVPAVPRVAESTYKKVMKQFDDNFPAIAERRKQIGAWVQSAYDLVLSPATSVMRRIGQTVPVANHLVDVFGRGAMGEKKRASNYHQRVRRMKARFLEIKYAKLNAAIDKRINDEIDALTGGVLVNQDGTKMTPRQANKYKRKRATEIKKNLVKTLRKKEGAERAKKGVTFTPQEQIVRNLFDDLHKYATDNGLPVRHIVNYLPKKIDVVKWEANRDRIIHHLMNEQGMTRPKARAYFDSITDRTAKDGRATEDAVQTPGFENMNSRTMKHKFFDEFQVDNLDLLVTDYVDAVVKRVEFNRVLGSEAPADTNFTHKQLIAKGLWNPKEKWEALIKQAEKEGATDQQIAQMEAYVEVNLGTYGRDHALATPKSRKVMANLIAYQNMRVLLYTVFASLPDAGGIIARAGVKNGAMSVAFKSIKDHIIEAGKTESGLADLARAIGEISSAMNDHIMTEYVDNDYMSPAMRKMNDAYFEYTGLNWYTNFTRKLSLAVGIDTILHQAEMAIPGRAKNEKGMFEAQAFLAELGITSEQVHEWNDAGRPVHGSLNYDESNPAHRKMAEALNQWVSESIMRPDASQRPILSSHPGLQLIYHLKTFTYSIQNTVIRRIIHNVEIANGGAEYAQAFAVPVIMMMALTAMGLELRELVKYFGSGRSGPTDRMDAMEYITELWQRAGLNGVTQLAWDFEDAEESGRNAWAGASGPLVSQVAETFSKPSTQTIPKALPVVGQLQGGRDAVRSVISPAARRRRKADRLRKKMDSGELIPYLGMVDGVAENVIYGDKKFQELYEGMRSPLKDGSGFMRVRPTKPLVKRDLSTDPGGLKFREPIRFDVAQDIEYHQIKIAPNNSVAAQPPS
jgi:hypothetical protein